MRTYTIHLRRHGPLREPDFVMVKEGFCWPAAALGMFWALWHRLWLVAVVLLAANVVVALATALAGAGPQVQGAVSLGFAAIVGFVANDFRRWTMERRGFAWVGIASGRRLEDAERTFLETESALVTEMAGNLRL